VSCSVGSCIDLKENGLQQGPGKGLMLACNRAAGKRHVQAQCATYSSVPQGLESRYDCRSSCFVAAALGEMPYCNAGTALGEQINWHLFPASHSCALGSPTTAA
jgi:hypothetical protein